MSNPNWTRPKYLNKLIQENKDLKSKVEGGKE
jgi:hypothetical protein